MREIPDVQQVPGEPVGFQLSYGKYRNGRALRWKAGRGFTHDAVDDGEAGVVKEGAILADK